MLVTVRWFVVVVTVSAALGHGCSSSERSPAAKKAPAVKAPAVKRSVKVPAAAKPAVKNAAAEVASVSQSLPEVLASPWRPSPPNALAHVGTPRPREVWSLSISPDGWTAAAACADGALRLWDLRTRSPGATYWAYEDSLNGVRYAPDGRHLITYNSHADEGALLWDARRMALLRRLSGKAPIDAAWAAGGRLLAQAYRRPKNLVQLVDPRTDELEAVVTPKKKGDLVFVLATPDGKHVLAAQDNKVHIWAVKGAKLEGSHELGSSSVALFGALSADGKLLAAVGDKHAEGMEGNPERPMVYLMDLTTRTFRGHLPHDAGSLDAFALAPDGKIAVAAAGKQLLIWRTDAAVPIPKPEEAYDEDDGSEAPKRKPRPPIPRDARPVQLRQAAKITALAFTPSSRAFLTADDKGEVRLWELGPLSPRGPAPRAKEVSRWHVWGAVRQGHAVAVKAVALSVDNKALWTRGQKTLRWDLTTLKPTRGGQMPASMAATSCTGLARNALRPVLPQALQKRINGACGNMECVNGDCEVGRAQDTVWVSANRKIAIASYANSWEGTQSDTTPGTLEVWTTGRKGDHKQNIQTSEASMLAISADGTLAAMWESMERKLKVYDLTKAEETKACQIAAEKTLGSGPDVAAFSLDGDRVAAAFGGKVTVWKVSGCAVHETLTITANSFSALGFSSDGRLLAAGLDDGTAVVLRLKP
jgi:WD40 repeat protein